MITWPDRCNQHVKGPEVDARSADAHTTVSADGKGQEGGCKLQLQPVFHLWDWMYLGILKSYAPWYIHSLLVLREHQGIRA